MATSNSPLASTPYICLVCSSIPCSQMAALAHHTFFIFKMTTMATILFKFFYSSCAFLQGEEDYYTRDQT